MHEGVSGGVSEGLPEGVSEGLPEGKVFPHVVCTECISRTSIALAITLDAGRGGEGNIDAPPHFLCLGAEKPMSTRNREDRAAAVLPAVAAAAAAVVVVVLAAIVVVAVVVNVAAVTAAVVVVDLGFRSSKMDEFLHRIIQHVEVIVLIWASSARRIIRACMSMCSTLP